MNRDLLLKSTQSYFETRIKRPTNVCHRPMIRHFMFL